LTSYTISSVSWA